MKKLNKLAAGCNAGAVNVSALLLDLGEAVKEYQQTHGSRGPAFIRNEPALKCIIGHISYLIGESAGPTESALEAFHESMKREAGDAVPVTK